MLAETGNSKPQGVPVDGAAPLEPGDALSMQDMWGMYVQGIISATGLPGSNLILTGTTLPATLATSSIIDPPPPTTAQALAQIYSFGDGLLLPQGFYTQTGQSFFNNYATYIDNLIPQGANPTPSQRAALTVVDEEEAAAQEEYSSDLQDAVAAYELESSLFPGRWASFQAYINTTQWGGRLINAQNAVTGAVSRSSSLKTEIFGQNYLAIANNQAVVQQVRRDLIAATPTSPAEMQISTDAGNFVVPTYVPSSLATFSTWVDNTATGPANNIPPEVSFTIRQGAAKYDFSQSTYFSNTTWGSDYFFYWVSGASSQQHNQVDVNTDSSSFSVQVSFQSVTTVQIGTGPWFDSSLMYAYSNSSDLVAPSALIIGMMPTVKVTFADETNYQTALNAYSASSSFGVGIFQVPGGTSTSSSSTDLQSIWDATDLSLTISNISIEPLIIGVQVWEPAT